MDQRTDTPPPALPDVSGCDVQWPYRADPPQRLKRQDGTFAAYLQAGGLARPHEDVRGFLAAEPRNAGDMARFYFFCLVQDQIAKEGVAGDFLELGTYKGGTASVLAAIARRLGRRMYVLDTFEGFAAADLQGIDADKRPEFADTSLEAVRALVGEANTSFIKGYFPTTATELPADGRYALVHIDCDLYAPIRAALDYFYPRMTPGGFMVVHDYSSLHWNGAERAVDEFFGDKPEFPIPLTDGAGSVVVRKAAPSGVAAPPEWIANDGLVAWLGRGWSGPEAWGVWGVGPAHEILLPAVAAGQGCSVWLDVHAALLAERRSQMADVVVNGRTVDTWIFTQAENRAVRRVTIGAEACAHGTPVSLELRPRDLRTPVELDPAAGDRRPLGVALHRLRMANG